jgi:hypothetical protein
MASQGTLKGRPQNASFLTEQRRPRPSAKPAEIEASLEIKKIITIDDTTIVEANVTDSSQSRVFC